MSTKVVNIVDRRSTLAAIRIGNERDNLAEHIQFVLPARLDGATVFLFLHIGDYSDVVQLDDDRIYTPTRTHTQYPGRWEAYLQAQMDGDVVWHSDVFTLYVGALPDSGEMIEQAYPTAIEEALRAVDTLTGVNARAETLEPGSEATVTFEVDAEGNRTIVYGIPRGKDGEGGNGNASGLSQSLRVAIYNLLMDAVYQSTGHEMDKEALEELLTGSSGGDDSDEEVIYYTIEKNLTNVTISNGAATVKAGSAYSATLTAAEGYTLSDVTVTMGGETVNVTDGVIDIASVTGNIVIIAVAEADETDDGIDMSWTSGVPYSKGDYAIEGYTLDIYGNEIAAEGNTCSDYLYCFDADYLVHTQTTSHLHFYDINKKWIKDDHKGSGINPVCHIVPENAVYARVATWINVYPVIKAINVVPGVQEVTYTKGAMENGENSGSGSQYTSDELIPIGGAIAASRNTSRVAVYDALGNYILQINSPTGFDNLNGVRWGAFSYMRIGDWANPPEFVLFDASAHKVTKSLTNVTCTGYNYANDGQSYTATVKASSGFVIASVSVEMGGDDITASVYKDGNITIPAATGEIVITAAAEAAETEE